jgi:hypothetical protein
MRTVLAVVALAAPASAFGAPAYEKGSNSAHPAIYVSANDGMNAHKVADGRALLAEFGGQDTSYGETVSPTGVVSRLGPRGANYIGFGISHDGSTVLAGHGFADPGGRHDIARSRTAAAR